MALVWIYAVVIWDIDLASTNFILDFGTVPTVWYFTIAFQDLTIIGSIRG